MKIVLINQNLVVAVVITDYSVAVVITIVTNLS